MGFYDGQIPALKCFVLAVRYTRNMTDKKPMSDEERQEFLDNLPEDEKRDNAEQVFDDAIARAVQPPRSVSETPDSADGYNDRQTRSDTTVDTSRSHNDTSHQSNA